MSYEHNFFFFSLMNITFKHLISNREIPIKHLYQFSYESNCLSTILNIDVYYRFLRNYNSSISFLGSTISWKNKKIPLNILY